MKKQEIINHLKPLEWEGLTTWCIVASGAGNNYYIEFDDRIINWRTQNEYENLQLSENVDEAKQACQKHYEEIILKRFN